METQKKQSGFGIASLVLGIISIITACFMLGIIPGILGIIFAIVGLCSKNRSYGTAIGGLICSIIGVLFFGFMLIMVGSDSSDEPKKVSQVENSQNSEGEESELESEISSQSESEEIKEEDLGLTKEIIFKEIPWGSSYSYVDEMYPDYKLMNISGDSYKTMSCDAILLGDYEGIDFEYTDINIIGNSLNGEVEIAGYTTTEMKLYFSYVSVDGVLTKAEEDSSFYGAQYVFEPKSLEEMKTDLIEKLSSIYGEPQKTTKDSDMWGNKYTYTYWYGLNDTELVLKTVDSSEDSTGYYEDEICISYVWRKGDELLQNASDTLKQEAIDKESEAYGSGSTDGL